MPSQDSSWSRKKGVAERKRRALTASRQQQHFFFFFGSSLYIYTYSYSYRDKMSQPYQLLPSSPPSFSSPFSISYSSDASSPPPSPTFHGQPTRRSYPKHTPSPRFDNDQSVTSTSWGWRNAMVAIGAFSRQDKGKQVVVEVKADGDQSGGRCFRDGGLGDERRESSDGDSLPTRSPSPGRDKVKSTTSRTLSVRALLIGAVVGTSVLAFIAWDRRQSSRDWSASAQQLGELFQFNRPTSGGNGSLIRMENGESFVYLNNL